MNAVEDEQHFLFYCPVTMDFMQAVTLCCRLVLPMLAYILILFV